jgi:hypothetical protein
MRITQRQLRRIILEEVEEAEGEELDYAEEFGEERPTPPPPLPKQFAGKDQSNLQIWFQGSKIRKKDGSPLRVFHGTNAEFTSFRVAPGGLYGPGIYFTDDPEVANNYTNSTGAYGKSSEDLDSKPNVVPAYLRVIRPFVIPSGNGGAPDLSTVAKNSGYDGIVIRSPGHPFHIVVVFDPRQVKSATGNTGDYDWSSEDITLENHLRRVIQKVLFERLK